MKRLLTLTATIVATLTLPSCGGTNTIDPLSEVPPPLEHTAVVAGSQVWVDDFGGQALVNVLDDRTFSGIGTSGDGQPFTVSGNLLDGMLSALFVTAAGVSIQAQGIRTDACHYNVSSVGEGLPAGNQWQLHIGHNPGEPCPTEPANAAPSEGESGRGLQAIEGDFTWTDDLGAKATLNRSVDGVMTGKSGGDPPSDISGTWANGKVHLELTLPEGQTLVADGIQSDACHLRVTTLTARPQEAAILVLHINHNPGEPCP